MSALVWTKLARRGRQAAVLAPEEPLVPARLSELHLMRGDTSAARRAAEEASRLGDTPLSDIVLGFANLATYRAASAEAAFRLLRAREAIELLASALPELAPANRLQALAMSRLGNARGFSGSPTPADRAAGNMAAQEIVMKEHLWIPVMNPRMYQTTTKKVKGARAHMLFQYTFYKGLDYSF